MVKLASIIVSVIVGIAGVAYSQEASIGSGGSSGTTDTPHGAVALYLELMSAGKFDLALELTNDPDNSSLIIDVQNVLGISEENALRVAEYMFQYEYELLSENISDNIALVSLEMETVDLVAAVKMVTTKLLEELPDEIVEGGDEALEKYIIDNLILELLDPNATTQNYEVDVYLEREDKDSDWYVEVSSELAFAMLGATE